MSKIIAIANQKGGVGKTTTTVNLSACVAALGKRVLCIDIDPQGNCTSGLGVDKDAPEHSIYDVMINGVSAAEATVKTPTEGLDLICARKELSGAEVELVNTLARETVLKRALDKVRKNYDYIFIDSPPVSRVNDACILANYIDGTIIVSSSNEVDIELAKLTKKRLSKVNANFIGVILNKFKDEDNIYHRYYGYYDEEDVKPRKFKFKWKR